MSISDRFALGTVALLVAWGAQARAQEAHPAALLRIAPMDQYLMASRDAEIALARSAAPPSIARDAEVLVLGAHGYETAVKGTNGFVCVVERGWAADFDDPAYMSPELRAPICFNPAAARYHVPLTLRRTALAMAGLSKRQIIDSLKASFDRHELRLPEPGAMCYMLSKDQNFGAGNGHWRPHVMFYVTKTDSAAWGAGVPGSPVRVHQDDPEPTTTFFIPVARWSDGTAALADAH
jgi:hypothetical protein